MRENKVFKITRKIINVFLAIIMIGFVIVVCMQRVSNNRLSFFNYRMFTVVSGSMAPKYNVGDILISKKVQASSIKIGDTISYEGTRGDFSGKVITHEVVGYDIDENGKYIFRAKGLTNLVEDPLVLEDQLYGKVIYKSFILSSIFKIISTEIGFYLFIILPVLYVIISEVMYMLLSKEEKRRGNS